MLLRAPHPRPPHVQILGEHNIAFIHGDIHKALRRSFLALFTRRALGMYLALQEAEIRKHLAEWVALGREIDIRTYVRDLNLRTSQRVFLGPYFDVSPPSLHTAILTVIRR